MEKLFGIFAFIMLLFVFSALTITTEYLTPFGTVTVSVSPTVFEWTVSVNADDYRTESYFEVHSPGFYVLVTDGHAPKVSLPSAYCLPPTAWFMKLKPLTCIRKTRSI